MDYAIVKTGGKQYRVSQGDVIDVDRLLAEAGGKVELTEVLLLSQGGAVTLGSPIIAGAKVVAEVQAQIRGEKVVVFRYKAKTRQGVKTGHRQPLTRLQVTEIVAESAPQPRRRRSRQSKEEEDHGS